MERILSLFPPNDCWLLAVIIGLPLLGAVSNGIFGKRVGKEAVSLMALSSVAVSFLGSLIAVALLSAQTGERAARLVWTGWSWLTVSGRSGGGPVPIEVAFSVDALSGAMALIVTGVGFLIHLYSTKYMEHDQGYHRYFAYLNLFIFSMLVLILGHNLPVLFLGWEGVGLCSYLLIGFWFGEERNAQAGKKAFITNRIGDFGLLVAMALLVYYLGALDWDRIEAGRKNLLVPVQLWPVGNTVPIADYLGADLAKWLNTPRYVNAATLVGLALFLGCAGKSAQIPLYVWLPDAMAGPTPVSALIHAATMVTAGVYLVCRMAGVFVLSPAAMLTVALVGAVTAVLAATIAFVQNDIKKVLAYSTVSQLGYMFLGVGVGAFAAGFFHVITHAFFKACLFLGAGSVIHALHARIHDTDASQDMRNMGGLRRYLPYTFWTFVAAWAAIVGLPLTSGFFSKDEILFRAFTSTVKSPVEGGVLRGDEAQIQLFQWPSWAPQLLYALGLAGAIMTAFYMTRLTVGIFAGEFRGWTVVKRWKDSAPEHHQHPADSGHLEGPIPQESPWQMTAPLVVLGGLSIVGGLLNAHAFFHYAPLDHWLEPVFASAATGIAAVSSAEHYEETLLALAFGAFVVGVGGAYWAYMMHAGRPARALAERMPGLHRLVYDKWRIDELYEATVLGAVDSLAEAAVWFDKWVVDFFVARVTSAVVAFSGYVLRQLQTGRVQAYATIMVLGLGGVGWYLTTPHASAATSSDDGAGHYSISASAGLGYHYRWDVDGDGNWDSEDFGDQASASLNLKVDEKRQVRLAVKNAFGRVSVRGIDLYRPKPDLSAAPAPAELERAVRAIQGARGDPQGARGGPPGGVLPLGTARAGVPGAQPGAQP